MLTFIHRVFFITLIAATFIHPISGFSMGKTPPADLTASQETNKPKPEMSLSQAFDFSLRRSEDIKMKKEDISRTSASFMEASGVAVGDINFVMTDSFQEPQKSNSESGGVGGTFTASERRERKFTLSQPLFQGFRSLGAILGSGNLKSQRKEEKAYAVQLLYLDVVHAYYSVLSGEKEIIVIKSIQELFKERIAELKERERVGRSRPGEIATAESRMKSLEADLARAQGALANSRHIFHFFTGVYPSEVTLLNEKEPNDIEAPENIMESALNRSDVEAAEQAMKIARNAVIVAQSDLWPKITLDGNQYEKREGFQSGIDWDAVIKFDVPLFKGGTTASEIKKAVVDYKKAKLTYQKTKREAELDIKKAFETWKSANDEWKSLSSAVESSELNYKLQKEDYERSLVSNLDVLQALETLLSTRQQTNQAEYRARESYWALKIATGFSPENLIEPKPTSVEEEKP